MAERLSAGAVHPSRGQRPQWSAFLELGFRPLYLAGGFWAAISIAVWVFAPSGLTGTLPGVYWHAHEMLWGFIATVAVGFLFTAGANWTGVNPVRGMALAGLVLLWGAARIGFLWPGPFAFLLAAACELAFFMSAAVALARVIYGTRNRNNYGIPVLVLGLAMADGLYLQAAWAGDFSLLIPRFEAGLLCMAVIAMLVARRVIPFFAMRGVAGLAIPMHAVSGRWQLAAGVLAIVCLLLGWMPALAWALAVAGAIALWQVWDWKPLSVRHVPLLWILYAGYAGLGIGLLLAAAHAAGWGMRAAWPVHAIGVAGFAVLIIGMVTRTALGHLGRPMRTDRSMVIAYGLVIAAALLRLAALFPSGWSSFALQASAGAWIIAFTLYVGRFFPWLIRPRADSPGVTPAGRPAGRS